MPRVNYTLERQDGLVVVKFVIEGGVIVPEELDDAVNELAKLLAPEKYGDKLVIVSGRGPIWLYGALLHYLHPFKAVAFYDPRLNGGVVVQSHVEEYRVGQVIPL